MTVMPCHAICPSMSCVPAWISGFFFRWFPAVPVPMQALLSKWLWSCSLAHCLFSLWLCCGGCSWNSLLLIKKPWQIITHTSDFTFNPCFMPVFTSSYLLYVLCISLWSNHQENNMFTPENVCCAVRHTLRTWFISQNCSICRLTILSDSMILPNINNWFMKVMPSVQRLFANVFRLFPFPRKHSWASGSEATPWLTASSACGFAVEDAAGIASCASTKPWQIITQTSDFTFNPCFMHGLRSSYLLQCFLHFFMI